MNPQKGFATIIAIIIGILVFGSVFYVTLQEKTYRNDEYGFTFKYPRQLLLSKTGPLASLKKELSSVSGESGMLPLEILLTKTPGKEIAESGDIAIFVERVVNSSLASANTPEELQQYEKEKCTNVLSGVGRSLTPMQSKLLEGLRDPNMKITVNGVTTSLCDTPPLTSPFFTRKEVFGGITRSEDNTFRGVTITFFQNGIIYRVTAPPQTEEKLLFDIAKSFNFSKPTIAISKKSGPTPLNYATKTECEQKTGRRCGFVICTAPGPCNGWYPDAPELDSLPINAIAPGTFPGGGTPTIYSSEAPADWKAYENKEYGVAWSYPSAYTLAKTTGGITGTKAIYVMKHGATENETTDFYFSIREPNVQKIHNLHYIPASVATIEALQSQLSQNCQDANKDSMEAGMGLVSCSSTRIYAGEEPAVMIDTISEGAQRTIYVLRNNLIYSFWGLGGVGYENSQILFRIAQTFRFTNP